MQFDSSYVDTRLGLHRLAAYVIAPARYRRTERFGLRAHEGGFATPIFDDGGSQRRIAVNADQLIDGRGENIRTATITTLQDAADFLGEKIDAETAAEHDTPALGDVHAELGVDATASSMFGEWFGAAFLALAQVGADAASVAASEPQLWPGHFDPAIEVGDEDHRASFGASPGDGVVDEPYLYVSVWWPDRLTVDFDEPIWNAVSFPGRQLRLSEFQGGIDPVETATTFWRETRDLLS